MKTYRDLAIVIHGHDVGEADRIVTLLTRDHGLVRAMAKGVRRTKSRFGARLEPFSLIDVQLYSGRNLDTVTQVESIHGFARSFITNYQAYTAAATMLETAERLLTTEHVADRALFTLLHGALAAMANGEHAPDLIMNSFLLRSLAGAGWQLAVFECAKCGTPGAYEAFNVQAGGAVCNNCRPASSTLPSIETWQLLGALLVGDWTVADTAGEATRRSAGALVAAYVQWHLEYPVRSLRLTG